MKILKNKQLNVESYSAFSIDDAYFSIETGLERVGVVGLDQDCRWAELEDAEPFGLG